MKLSALGEFGLIETIRHAFSRKSSGTLLGIGDDAAALRIAPSSVLLATTDMLLEGVHFDLSYTDFYSLGWKSAAANLSDIAAMGGLPRFCLTALGIPRHLTVEQIREFYRGFSSLARKHATALVGGDTCRSRTGFTVSVTLLGEVKRSELLRRSGARPGDRIFVTGTLGDSAAGLELLRKAECPDKPTGTSGMGNKKSAIRNPKSAMTRLRERHLRPVPRVEWGRAIARCGCATAMIDVSDGLSSDLNHICEESGVGAEVAAHEVPLSRWLRAASNRLRMPVRFYALSGGEEYELLFTVPPRKVRTLRTLGLRVTEIGVITRERGMFLTEADGRRGPLTPSGYDHFRDPGARRRARQGRRG